MTNVNCFFLILFISFSCTESTSDSIIEEHNELNNQDEELRYEFLNRIDINEYFEEEDLLIFHINSTGCGSCDDRLKHLVNVSFNCRKFLLLKDTDTLKPQNFNVDRTLKLNNTLFQKYGVDAYYGFVYVLKGSKIVEYILLDKDSTYAIESKLKLLLN